MQTEETKNNGTEDGCSTFGCCDPEEFKKMFEKKCRCLSGQSDAADFSAMKEGMMKKMMEMYCGSRAEETITNAKSQKVPEAKDESTEKQCGCL